MKQQLLHDGLLVPDEPLLVLFTASYGYDSSMLGMVEGYKGDHRRSVGCLASTGAHSTE